MLYQQCGYLTFRRLRYFAIFWCGIAVFANFLCGIVVSGTHPRSTSLTGVGMQTLVEGHFADDEQNDVDCSCGKQRQKGCGKVIEEEPDQLVIALKRYKTDMKSYKILKSRAHVHTRYFLDVNSHSINNPSTIII